MTDPILDSLYTNYFNQLLRSKHSPTFIEKNVLDETVNIIRNYILGFVKEIRKGIHEYEERKSTSSLVWDVDFYKKECYIKYEILDDFETKIKETFTHKFLERDFSKTNSVIDEIYPSMLPKSQIREVYTKYWKTLKEKDE